MYRARLLVAALVAAVALAAVPSIASAAERCSVDGAKVVLQNDQARVLSKPGKGTVSRTFYGCVRGSRPIVLTRNRNPRSDEDTHVSNTSFRLTRRAVAWVETASSDFGVGEYGLSVRGRVLRRGAFAFGTDVTDTGSIENLAVRADGAAAWVAGTGRKYREVDAIAPGSKGAVPLGYATQIDPASLKIDDAGVHWTEAGSARTAQIGPPRPSAPSTTAAPGPHMLDATYERCGVLTPSLGTRSSTAARAIARGPDGSIAVAGGGNYGEYGDSIVVSKLRPDGSLDPGFDGDGVVATDIPRPAGAQQVVASGVAVQGDGKIVVSAYIRLEQPQNSRAVLVRHNPDGTVDRSFGQGGIVHDALPGARSARITDITLDGTDRIVASAVRNTSPEPFDMAGDRFVVARFGSNGSLDPAFGAGGITTLDTPPGPGRANTVAMSGDKIVAGGQAGDQFVLARLNSDGTPDPAFAEAGRSLAAPPGLGAITAVAVLGDGRVLATGTLSNIVQREQVALARYRADGGLDETFGNGGFATDRYAYKPQDIAPREDGRLLVAAQAHWPNYTAGSGLVRYDADGSRDESFAQSGALVSNASADSQPNALLPQPDGSVLAALDYRGNFAVARYAVDGPALAAAADAPRVCAPSISTKSIRQLIRRGKRARYGKLRIVFRRAQPGPVRLGASVRVGSQTRLLGTGWSRSLTAGTSIGEIKVRPNVYRLLRKARSARVVVSVRGIQGGGVANAAKTLKR